MVYVDLMLNIRKAINRENIYIFYFNNNSHNACNTLKPWLYLAVSLSMHVCLSQWCFLAERQVWKPCLWQGDRVTVRGDWRPLRHRVTPLDGQVLTITGDHSVFTDMRTNRRSTHASTFKRWLKQAFSNLFWPRHEAGANQWPIFRF